MNQLNYASREASDRLYDAGIVLETEKMWSRPYLDEPWISINSDDSHLSTDVPAPSMTEVWRELPEEVEHRGVGSWILSMNKMTVGYCRGGIYAHFVKIDINPTDVPIDLLIWVRKEKGE